MSQKKVLTEQTVYPTKWFALVAKSCDPQEEPYYSIRTLDYVAVVPVTPEGWMVLVRQFRPAVERFTLELPCGHVEPGEKPELAAANELLEETGYRAGAIHFLGRCSPDTGRMANQMWSYFAPNVKLEAGRTAEHGIEVVLYKHGLTKLLAEPDFLNALSLTSLLFALRQGRLRLGSSR
jgi:ADP-ribose pyrophosphatase